MRSLGSCRASLDMSKVRLTNRSVTGCWNIRSTLGPLSSGASACPKYCSQAIMPRLPHGAPNNRASGQNSGARTCGKNRRKNEFMSQALFDKIESEQFRKEPAPFEVGDSVRVHTKVVEGDKERIQIFAGVVIGRRGRGLNSTFTVRRISYGEGVERVFPLHSPRVEKVEVERRGEVRRAKLTYLRKRLGKGATLVKEKETRTTAAAAAKAEPVGAGK